MLAGFLLAQYCLQQYLGGNQRGEIQEAVKADVNLKNWLLFWCLQVFIPHSPTPY